MDSASAPSGSAPRFWSLEALRGICALVVFLSHWHLWSDFAPRGKIETAIHAALSWCNDTFGLLAWPTGGNHPAVICFFVLSGFCIHYPFERRARSGAALPGWREHYRRRFWRIMPVYWSAAALGVVFVVAQAWRPAAWPLLALHGYGPPHLILVRFLGLYDFVPQEIIAGNHPLNTVAVELVIYAIYPWFFFHAVRQRWIGLAGVFLALQGIGLALLPWVSPFWIFNSVCMLGLFWYAGALAARLFVAHGPRDHFRSLLLAWAGFLVLKAVPHFYGLNILKQNLWALVCVLGLLQCLHLEARRPQLGSRPALGVLRYAGEISYPLYAMHAPAMMLGSWALWHAGTRSYSLQLGATFGVSLGFTLAVHYGIERVFYRPHSSAPPVAVPARY